MKSEIELFYDAIRKHFGNEIEWNNLPLPQQQHFIHAINIILSIVVVK